MQESPPLRECLMPEVKVKPTRACPLVFGSFATMQRKIIGDTFMRVSEEASVPVRPSVSGGGGFSMCGC